MSMMLFKAGGAGAAAIALLGLMAPAHDAGAAPNGVSCEIRMVKRASGVELTALVHAAKATNGTYSFRVSQNGSSGSSLIDQGGAFVLGAGQSDIVGEATLGNAKGVQARLSVTTADGTTTFCKR